MLCVTSSVVGAEFGANPSEREAFSPTLEAHD